MVSVAPRVISVDPANPDGSSAPPSRRLVVVVLGLAIPLLAGILTTLNTDRVVLKDASDYAVHREEHARRVEDVHKQVAAQMVRRMATTKRPCTLHLLVRWNQHHPTPGKGLRGGCGR